MKHLFELFLSLVSEKTLLMYTSSPKRLCSSVIFQWDWWDWINISNHVGNSIWHSFCNIQRKRWMYLSHNILSERLFAYLSDEVFILLLLFFSLIQQRHKKKNMYMLGQGLNTNIWFFGVGCRMLPSFSFGSNLGKHKGYFLVKKLKIVFCLHFLCIWIISFSECLLSRMAYYSSSLWIWAV